MYGVVQKILAKVRSGERAFLFFGGPRLEKGNFAPRAAARPARPTPSGPHPEARCAEIRADYDKQAQDQYWARVRDGVKACEDRVQRMGRLAEMEARKSVLALKQEMVDAAFAAALDKICTMPQADYVAYLAKLAAQAATTGTETLVFNAKDQAACGQAVVDAANALLAQQGKPGRLTMSQATRDLRAGFVLQQGDIEVNCAVETIAELCRSDLAAQVAEVLFGA